MGWIVNYYLYGSPYFHIQPRYAWITHHGCAVCGAVQQLPKNTFEVFNYRYITILQICYILNLVFCTR
jgi:hypothetical protein